MRWNVNPVHFRDVLCSQNAKIIIALALVIQTAEAHHLLADRDQARRVASNNGWLVSMNFWCGRPLPDALLAQEHIHGVIICWRYGGQIWFRTIFVRRNWLATSKDEHLFSIKCREGVVNTIWRSVTFHLGRFPLHLLTVQHMHSRTSAVEDKLFHQRRALHTRRHLWRGTVHLLDLGPRVVKGNVPRRPANGNYAPLNRIVVGHCHLNIDRTDRDVRDVVGAILIVDELDLEIDTILILRGNAPVFGLAS